MKQKIEKLLTHKTLQYTPQAHDLAKELQDYTQIVGVRNKHIQYVATTLVNLTQPVELNDHQQLVLAGLTYIYNNYEKEFHYSNCDQYALRDLYWYLSTDYDAIEDATISSMCESYYLLKNTELSQVLQVFGQWTQKLAPR